jgi:hypothetical protein
MSNLNEQNDVVVNKAHEIKIAGRYLTLEELDRFEEELKRLNQISNHARVIKAAATATAGESVLHFKHEPINVTPPKPAEYLLYLFLSKDNREAILGDLEEEFHEVEAKFGMNKARIYYWVQVIKSIYPLLITTIKNVIKLVVISKLTAIK